MTTQTDNPRPARRVTPEALAYIAAHRDDRPRRALARAAGVSVSELYRVLRGMGAPMRYDLSTRNPEWERAVRDCYATMSGGEIARRFGIPRSRVNAIARSLGLRHSAETAARVRREQLLRLRGGSDPEVVARRIRRRSVTLRIDELRLLSGQPQRTAFHFREMTRRAYKAKWRLMRAYGYAASPADPYALLHGPATRRRPHGGAPRRGSEEYYAAKYRLTFAPLGGGSR